MAITRTLSDDARSMCPQCRAVVWRYETPAARTVVLDRAPGPYIIDGRRRAFLSERADGYRAHECTRTARAPLSAEVTDCEFLWR
jgi:hypothetical protein